MTTEHLQRDSLRHIFTHSSSNFTLRMAPMIDMIFLLLIFFLVAAKFKPPESFLPIQLAAAHGQTPTIKPEPLIIYLNSQANGCRVQIADCGVVTISQAGINEDFVALTNELTMCLKNQRRFLSDPVEIICADDVKWDHLAKIYNLLFGMGLNDITFSITE